MPKDEQRWPGTEKRGDGETPWRCRFINASGERDSASGFATSEEAYLYKLDQETDIRRGVYIDPRQGAVSVGQYAAEWIESLDVGPLSLRDYKSRLRARILPRWGDIELGAITGLAVRTWSKQLRTAGLAESTIDGHVMVLRMMLDDAVSDRMLTANPIVRKGRRGKFKSAPTDERLWANGPAADAVAANAYAAHDLMGYGICRTIEYTGLRMQELAGLRREHVHLTAKRHQQWINVPKQAQYIDGEYQLIDCKYDSGRKLVINPGLAHLLGQVLSSHDSEWVFLQAKGAQIKPGGSWYSHYWRVWTAGRDAIPSSRGHRARAAIPAVPGYEELDPHGLRHGHKVALDEDGHPKVAVEARMGHRLQGVERVYSHVSPEMERRISETLEARWERSAKPAGLGVAGPVAIVPPEATEAAG